MKELLRLRWRPCSPGRGRNISLTSVFDSRRHQSSDTASTAKEKLKDSYDVVIVGAGHNGLVSAAYLQKAGYSVCVLERRDVMGGAAVTEEIIPGFKFSRASYLLSLLRPYILSDLKLKDFGLRFHVREPYNSFTPIRESLWPSFPAKFLLMSSSPELSQKEISKFSERDARNYVKYEKQMSKFVTALTHLVDHRPPNLGPGGGRGFLFSWSRLKALSPGLKALRALGTDLPQFHELLTASAQKILDKWFESEPLKATLATDALIGTMSGPNTPGTGYVLLHHLMGGVEGKAGAWAYPEGGMGAVSEAIGASARTLGAHIFTNAEVSRILFEKTAEGGRSRATGVLTRKGQEVKARKAVFSGTTPHVTFTQLLDSEKDGRVREALGQDFLNLINAVDYTSPVTKINVALSRLPDFAASPSRGGGGRVEEVHKCTIHLNCERMADLTASFQSCQTRKEPSERPMIEMVLPSSLDGTLAPAGAHVCHLFTQYTPYSPEGGSWAEPGYKEAYAQSVFDLIETYAPGFKSSVVGKEVLSPWDLEQTFNLTGGNIFHGAMSVDQLYWLRPVGSSECWFPETPIQGLYLCGSGSHPGGGVMGVPGYLAAKLLTSSPS